MIPIVRPQFGQEEQLAIQEVLSSGHIAQGTKVREFEDRFAALCQVRAAIAVSSGTAALHLTLLAHKIGPGDEVITTPFSFAATANVIRLVGAVPVFVDIEPDSYNLSPYQVEAAITPRTKALLPVHLYGNPAQVDQLAVLCEKYQLALIEDACQAHAATLNGKPVGSFGTGCFSFYATKNMTTGEGGMITTDDADIADCIRLMRNHGQRERYCHVALGYNQRMTDLQAAIGLAQLDKLSHFTARRSANAAFYNMRLAERLQVPVARPGHLHVYHQYTIRVPRNRDAVARGLAERGVETAIHYPLPIHKQPIYQGLDHTGALPVAETAADEVLSLPVHPGLSEEDLEIVAREVIALCQLG